MGISTEKLNPRPSKRYFNFQVTGSGFLPNILNPFNASQFGRNQEVNVIAWRLHQRNTPHLNNLQYTKVSWQYFCSIFNKLLTFLHIFPHLLVCHMGMVVTSMKQCSEQVCSTQQCPATFMATIPHNKVQIHKPCNAPRSGSCRYQKYSILVTSAVWPGGVATWNDHRDQFPSRVKLIPLFISPVAMYKYVVNPSFAELIPQLSSYPSGWVGSIQLSSVDS